MSLYFLGVSEQAAELEEVLTPFAFSIVSGNDMESDGDDL
jgi:hypothetical protein